MNAITYHIHQKSFFRAHKKCTFILLILMKSKHTKMHIQEISHIDRNVFCLFSVSLYTDQSSDLSCSKKVSSKICVTYISCHYFNLKCIDNRLTCINTYTDQFLKTCFSDPKNHKILSKIQFQKFDSKRYFLYQTLVRKSKKYRIFSRE